MGIEVEGAKLSKVKLLVKFRFHFYTLSDNAFLFLHSFRKISSTEIKLYITCITKKYDDFSKN